MTWSIIAKETATGRIGIIVASKFFAVGSLVPNIKTGVGAVCTQAFVNPYFGPRGLAMLSAGASAEDTVKLLVTADEGRDNRQLHAMDNRGRFQAHTGVKCIEWCGHQVRDTFSVAGNMLAGPQVIDETIAAYEAGAGLPLARRLMVAMQAGERAGGDKRGKQSAALLMHDTEDYPLLDLRVDDNLDPLTELERLYSVARERWLHFRRVLPRNGSEHGLLDRSELDAFIAASIASKFE